MWLHAHLLAEAVQRLRTFKRLWGLLLRPQARFVPAGESSRPVDGRVLCCVEFFRPKFTDGSQGSDRVIGDINIEFGRIAKFSVTERPRVLKACRTVCCSPPSFAGIAIRANAASSASGARIKGDIRKMVAGNPLVANVSNTWTNINPRHRHRAQICLIMFGSLFSRP